MADSLRDQLLKAGMATKKQAKAAERDLREQAHQARKEGKESDEGVEAAVRAAAEAQRARAEADRERARAMEEEKRQQERLAQVRDMIRQQRKRLPEKGTRYNFDHGGYVESITVTEEMRFDLAKGRLAIAFLDDDYHVVPAATAQKILERLPEVIVCLHQPQSAPPPDPDDPYADYVVPDDLIW